MSNHTTLCANVLCANSAKMNGLVLETKDDSNSGAITSTTNSVPLLTLKNTNTDANSAAIMQLKSHPADNVQTDGDEIGLISFVGVDAAGALAEYGAILCSAPDTDAGGEEGSMAFGLACSGARQSVLSITGAATAATTTVSITGFLNSKRPVKTLVDRGGAGVIQFGGADATIAESDSGTMFLVPALTTGAQTITLPATSAGLEYTFMAIHTVGQVFRVVAAGSDRVNGEFADADSSFATGVGQASINMAATATCGHVIHCYGTGSAGADAWVFTTNGSKVAGFTVTAP